jgi:hypothetical protein
MIQAYRPAGCLGPVLHAFVLAALVCWSATATAQTPRARRAAPDEPAPELPAEVNAAADSEDGVHPLKEFEPIMDLTVDVRLEESPEAQLPPDPSAKLFSGTPAVPPRKTAWTWREFRWSATELWHWPLYFEDAQLERYGQMRHPAVQPMLSGVHFFGTLPILPYKMGLERPCDCVSNLGYYRPGNCTPPVGRRLPLEADAAAFESAAWLALIFVLP